MRVITKTRSNVLLDSCQVETRPLTALDAPAYRRLRQQILFMGEGKYFSSSYVRERSFTDAIQWERWCTETNEHCTIGTFIKGRLVGIMGIVAQDEAELCDVEWEATWLDPQYRNCGVAKLAYEKVWLWTAQHEFTTAVVLIREDNLRSRQIRERQGARRVSTKHDEVWADGSVADAHVFRIELSMQKSLAA